MNYHHKKSWLLVTVISLCAHNVACKPAKETLNRTPQEINSLNTDLSTNKEGELDHFWWGNSGDDEELGNVTVNEDESIHSQNHSAGDVYYDAADWVKEAEQWTFKGGDWGLVKLPSKKHPDIPNPPVPGPVLIAEGNSLGKVIVSRDEENLENLTLHFSYFLSNNPNNPPILEVYQIQEETHKRVSVEATYGEWATSTVPLPYSGKFEIKFIGQRIVDTNEIALDDIVLRGFYMEDEKESGDSSLQEEEDEVYDDTDSDQLSSDSEDGKEDNHVEGAVLDENNNTKIIEDQISNNAGQTVEDDNLNGDNDTQAIETGDEVLDTDVSTVKENYENVNTNNQFTVESNHTNENDTMVTDIDDQVQVNETQVDDDDDKDKVEDTQATVEDNQVDTDNEENGSTPDNEDYWDSIYDDDYESSGEDYYNEQGWGFNDWFNNKPNNNDPTDDSNIDFHSIDANGVDEVSVDLEDTGPGVAIIMFWCLSVTGFILLGLLYWRRSGSRYGNEERTIFNRANVKGQNDFDRLMYSDVPYEDDDSDPKNYNSFD